MHTDIAERLVAQFERGLLSRRQLASRLLGLGAALTATSSTAGAAQDRKSTFQATGLDHVALDVREVARSRVRRRRAETGVGPHDPATWT